MTAFSDIPADGNYSGWRDYLGDKVESCDSTFQSYSLTWGQSIFGSFDDSSKAAALETALDGGSIGGDYLFSKRSGEFAFVIIGIILLVIAIVAALALTKCLRRCVSRCVCGKCKDRDRVRMKDSPPHDRSFLVVSHVIAAVGIIVLGVLCYITTAQSFQGLRSASCNMWEQLYGHFFGATDLHQGDYKQIAMNWQGTYAMIDSMGSIGAQATPDPTTGNSSLYNTMYSAYLEMRQNATTKADLANALVQEFMDNATVFQMAVMAAAPPLMSYISLTADPSILKGEMFQAELRDTLSTGWSEIERLLTKYAGPEAALTLSAVDSVNASTTTVQQVDRVMAELARLWDDATPMLNGLVYAVGSIEIIAVSVGIVFAFGLIWLTFKLRRELRDDVMPKKKERTLWAAVYGTACVLAGIFALLCAIHVLTAAVGSDACLMAEDALFIRGNWNILGNSILHPIENMEVDVKAVLDTCVRVDGNGDVASALGLDGRIRVLSDAVVEAEADISATREALLGRQEKSTRAQVLALGFHDVAEMVTRSWLPNESGLFEAKSFFNETRFVRADFDEGYDEHGPRSVICLVPRLNRGTEWIIYNCLGDGLQLDVAPLNVLADVTNEALDIIGITDGSVPRELCSPLLARGGHSCGTRVQDGGFGWINNATDININTDIDGNPANWTETINSVPFVASQPEGAYYKDAGHKVNYAIQTLINLEKMAETQMGSLNIAGSTGFCPTPNQDCKFRDARENAVTIFETRSQEIYPAVLELFAIVDSYVDDIVNPTMESLVVQANEITDGGNCQYEGTALHYGVLPPLCEATFPANAVGGIFTGILSVLFFLLAITVWKWYHYLDDLARTFDTPEEYELSKEHSQMNQNANFVRYSGMPTAAASPLADSIRDTETVAVDRFDHTRQPEVVHARLLSNPLFDDRSPVSEYTPAAQAEPVHVVTRTYVQESYARLDSIASDRGYILQSEDSFETYRG